MNGHERTRTDMNGWGLYPPQTRHCFVFLVLLLFPAKRSKRGHGAERPCAGSGDESLRAPKRARSGGFNAARRRAERMRHVPNAANAAAP